MGPLITQGIISPEWNPIIAFIIGIAFGFALEQGGFSSSRKLAGVFYGYDMTTDHTPYEVGIGFTVTNSKSGYRGCKALAAAKGIAPPE